MVVRDQVRDEGLMIDARRETLDTVRFERTVAKRGRICDSRAIVIVILLRHKITGG